MVDLFLIFGAIGIAATLLAAGLCVFGPVGIRLLAARYVRSTLVTVLGVTGVALGLVVIIVIKSVVAGLLDELENRMKAVASDVKIRARFDDGGLDDLQRLREIDAASGEVAAPVAIMRVRSADGISIKHCSVVGIDPARAFRASDLARYMKLDDRQPLDGLWAVGGRDLFTAPDVAPGDTVTIQLAFQRDGRWERTPPTDFTVAGTLETGIFEIDKSTVFVPLGFMRDALGDAGFPVVKVRLAPGITPDAAMRAAGVPPGAYYTYRDEFGHYLRAVEDQGGKLLLMAAVVIAVSAVGIVTLVIMIVLQKIRDIGILRAVGAGRSTILAAFLSYAILVGLAGTGLGLAGSAAMLWRIDDVKRVTMRLTGYNPISKQFYTDESVPVHWLAPMGRARLLGIGEGWPFAVMAPAAAVGLVALGALAPAWWASRRNPVAAIHYE